MSAVLDTHGKAHEHGHHDHHGGYSGIMRWVTTTNHKDIGTMYLWFCVHHVHRRRGAWR